MSNDKKKVGVLDTIVSIIIAMIVGICITLAFDLDKFDTVGYSMYPSIAHGDHIVTNNKFLFMDIEYERYDVIVFVKDGRAIIKRIMGLPGERVQIEDGEIIINGWLKDNSFVLNKKMEEVRDLKLGPDEYYVLGDNRPYSQDSRHDGPINRRQIIGRVFLRWRSLNVP